MTTAKRRDLTRHYVAQAREYHRTHNVVLRDQTLRSLEELLSRAESRKIIAGLQREWTGVAE